MSSLDCSFGEDEEEGRFCGFSVPPELLKLYLCAILSLRAAKTSSIAPENLSG